MLVVNVLIIIASILLVLIVLVQNSKGGGLASNFSASNQVIGVKKTTEFLGKATWALAIALVILCMLSTLMIDKTEVEKTSILGEEIEQTTTLPENTPSAEVPEE